MSTFRRAWIFPLAVTLETRSVFSTLAVVTRGTSLSRPRMDAVSAPTTTTAATTPMMIFVLFDMPSTLRMYAVFQRILFYGGGVGKFNLVWTIEKEGHFR